MEGSPPRAKPYTGTTAAATDTSWKVSEALVQSLDKSQPAAPLRLYQDFSITPSNKHIDFKEMTQDFSPPPPTQSLQKGK